MKGKYLFNCLWFVAFSKFQTPICVCFCLIIYNYFINLFHRVLHSALESACSQCLHMENSSTCSQLELELTICWLNYCYHYNTQ